MKITTNSALNAFFIAVLALFSPSIGNAAAPITTQFCMLVTATHGGSDSKAIYVNLTGVNGSTGQLNLDNLGRDDFKSKQWSCFEFPLADLTLSEGKDVGFHTKAEVGFKPGDMDDFCVTQMYSRRQGWYC